MTSACLRAPRSSGQSRLGRSHNPEVAGSNPAPATNESPLWERAFAVQGAGLGAQAGINRHQSMLESHEKALPARNRVCEMATLSMGIDLASQPKKTAVCIVRWEGGRASLASLARGLADDGSPLHTKWLSTTAYGVRGDYGAPITKVGIDAPFGWPEPFLDAVAAYRDGPSWPVGMDNPLDECRLRETDRAVHRRSGKWPLSVAADRIALPAMRCASLLTDIGAHAGADAVARDGAGLCCEVYPDPALRYWTDQTREGLAPRESYKGADKGDRRRALLSAILTQVPLEDVDRRLEKVAGEDDYLDALICALVARAAELGLTHPPQTEAELGRAPLEGWIHLPSRPLERLWSAGAV
jgi:predicted nuclease with RNAse H fold